MLFSKYVANTGGIFQATMLYFLGWINEKKASKIFGLDLLEEYAFPQPMPEDKFYDYHIETNQAYLMLATEGTGIYLICIMFNSTFRGRNTKKFV